MGKTETAGRSAAAASFAAAYVSPARGSTGFASGARVLTRRGELLVDQITEGDEVLSPSGRWERVTGVEVGDCADAVRVRRDAFGAAEPHRDVSVGADQLLSVRGALVPASDLVDRVAVHPERPSNVRFYRFRLDHAGFAMVDGLTASLPEDPGERCVPPPRRGGRPRMLAAV